MRSDEYGHYDEYMMSTYDSPNFLPMEHSSKLKISPTGDDDTADKKQKAAESLQQAVQITENVEEPQAVYDDDQLFTIILPKNYYSAASNTSGEEVNYNDKDKPVEGGAAVVSDYDMELPPPMKSPTVFDYHEVSIDDYDWDRIFGEASSSSLISQQ